MAANPWMPAEGECVINRFGREYPPQVLRLGELSWQSRGRKTYSPETGEWMGSLDFDTLQQCYRPAFWASDTPKETVYEEFQAVPRVGQVTFRCLSEKEGYEYTTL